MKRLFLLSFLTVLIPSVHAQDLRNLELSGSPIVVVFADYTAGLGKANDVSGFNLTRSRLGYQLQIGNALKATTVLDINANSEAIRTVNFHYVMLEWAYKNLTLGGGMIALAQFGVAEAFWGRRYIEKSFQDLNGFGFDSDLGVIAKYKFADWLSADFSLTNGEGTMKLNTNNSNKYALGLTVQPLEGLFIRAYGDVFTQSEDLYPAYALAENASFKSQRTVAVFAGYRNEHFSLGAEFNKQFNRSFIDGCDYQGYSVYTGVPLSSKVELYGRYDYVDTDTPEGITYDWLSVANKNTLIAGLEYHPIKQLYVSPNYRYIEPLYGDGFHAISLNLGFSW
ncbi:hypothetical protein [Parabacteroides sp. PF5-9]|uniref:hypothetical protein n=1 Tax=Parabacteroides sp. PF5-9 TaxID=1742404 RepID=UPI00247719CC|nr:hypothetical protein [Parabacteroides sp. PF5-9]